MGDIATAAGVVVAIALGVLGLVDAKRSRRLAKEANLLAEKATRAAADAVSQAADANRLAEDANQLSEQANAIAERTHSQVEEDWLVQWAVQWDEDQSTLRVLNRGRDHALQPSVVVTTDDLHRVYRGLDDVPAGGELTLPLPEIAQQRSEWRAEWAAFGPSNVIPALFHPMARVVIRWKTGLGFPDERILEQQLG